MDTIEDICMLTTGLENDLAFKLEMQQHDDLADFLANHEYIPLRSTKVSLDETESSLNIISDIDGVTIEWSNISECSHVFHHLFLLARGKSSLKFVYQWLKKHVDLVLYSNESRSNLKSCVGIPFFTDSGWEYVLALIPSEDNRQLFNSDVISHLTWCWLLDVKKLFRQRLYETIPSGTLRRTIDKNNVNDVSQIFILPSDSEAVLAIFQDAINNTNPPNGFRKILFSYRFGEKNRDGVSLPIRDPSGISKVCVHVGISIEPILSDQESVFWSRHGLKELVGWRGSLTTSCSLFECANFQSNLDGRAMDVSGKLRRVCCFPERITFLQLYADVPHRYPKSRHHPVSASIIFESGLRNATDALRLDAQKYISEIESNFLKFTNSVCRLEFVMPLHAINTKVVSDELINKSNIAKLLANTALIVPFACPNGSGVMTSLRSIGLHLSEKLQKLFETLKGTGSATGVWESYQYELAVEKILWGHPLTYLSNQFSVNLGPGLDIPTRCASDQYGCIRLENKFSCCAVENSTPPLAIYTKSECVQNQILKMFGFYDSLCGSSLVLGRKLVELVLRDFYDIGTVQMRLGEFTAAMKDGRHSLRVVGVTSRKSLAQYLTGLPKCKFPMVLPCLMKLLISKGKNAETLIATGLEELKLVHFPAIRTQDSHGNKCINWTSSFGVWAIKDLADTERTCIDARSSLLCALVLNELERRKLCYTRCLSGTIDSFPWVTPCLRKLDELGLNDEHLVLEITFITCVAFLEHGQFVDYNRFRDLHDEMPIKQRRLRDLEIQGKFLVNNMNKFMVWRLHESIPHRPPKRIAEIKHTRQQIAHDQMDDNDNLQLPIIGENTSEANSAGLCAETDMKQRHLPEASFGRWTSQELAIINSLMSEKGPAITLYRRYQTECRHLDIPDRSFAAFRRKIGRNQK